VTRHADFVAVNRDTDRFSSELGGTQRVSIGGIDPEFDTRGVMLIDTDPPQHTRYRRLVNKGFTPRMVSLLEAHLKYRAELIVDAVVEVGSCDLVTDLAAELPLQAIADIMGVPQEDRHLMFEWTNQMVGAQDPEYADDRAAGRDAALAVYAYADNLADQRREDPRDDIVTALINAEIDGERLTENEFNMFMLLLTVAGSETTRNAIASGTHALMTRPDELARLQADETLWPTAIEEVLRWSSPVLHFRRTATVDTTLAGKDVSAGDKVLIWHVSANRDESVFTDPFTFDVSRTPNDHVAFGAGGPHFCLGANLARVELRLLLQEVFTRLPDITPAAEPERLRSNFIAGIKHLPVTFTPGARIHPRSQG
jgi:cholest-4-en-3-one 26-monooxygenase